jgi:hypothetical protein
MYIDAKLKGVTFFTNSAGESGGRYNYTNNYMTEGKKLPEILV